MSERCKYCGKQMNDDLLPYYCDFQQGRCPHLKKPPAPTWLTCAIFALLALLLLYVGLRN